MWEARPRGDFFVLCKPDTIATSFADGPGQPLDWFPVSPSPSYECRFKGDDSNHAREALWRGRGPYVGGAPPRRFKQSYFSPVPLFRRLLLPHFAQFNNHLDGLVHVIGCYPLKT